MVCRFRRCPDPSEATGVSAEALQQENARLEGEVASLQGQLAQMYARSAVPDAGLRRDVWEGTGGLKGKARPGLFCCIGLVPLVTD